MTEETSCRLAYRTYMYELFHVVFGATPNADEVERLQSGMTLQALEYYAARQQGDARRAAFAACADAFEALGQGDDARDAAVEALKSSYTRLFLVPGEDYVRPWESPYVGKEVMVFQESTLDVRRRYAEYGFEAAEYKHFPEDHLAMMMHFLGALSSEAYEAYMANDNDGGDGGDGGERVRAVLRSQQSFIKDHLTNWLAKFLQEVDEKDALGFYRACAHALDAFLQDDAAYLERALSGNE